MEGASKGWLAHLRTGLHRTTAGAVSLPRVITPESVQTALACLQANMETAIRMDLLCNKVEILCFRELWAASTGKPVLKLRPYLRVRCHNHRVALTRFLCGGHGLEVETRLFDTPLVPREQRRCRACNDDVEDVTHAIFLCKHSGTLNQAQERFLANIASATPRIPLPPSQDKDA